MIYVVYDKYGWMVGMYYTYQEASKVCSEVNGHICERIVNPWG